MLNKKTERPDKLIIEPPSKKTVKIYEKITKEQAFALKEYWESKNFSGFNEYIQRTGSKINVLEAIQIIKNTQFSVKLELENFSGVFKGKFFGNGVGKNKKDARKNALSQIIDQLIQKNLLVNIDDGQMECINKILQEKHKNSNNYNSNNYNNNSGNIIYIRDDENSNRKNYSLILLEKDIKLEYFRQMQKNKDIDDNLKKIQNYSKTLLEGKIDDNEKIKAIRNLCDLLKNKLEWNDISYIWYQFIIKGDKEHLDDILNILFSKSNAEFINQEIKKEILDSFIFLIPYVNTWKKLQDLIETFFKNVNYYNEDILFTDYYCNFKKSYHVEMLNILYHLFRSEVNSNLINLINPLEIIGTLQINSSRYGQEICTFLPLINANYIKKVNKEMKNKCISENEIVSIEINKNKKEIALITKINNDLIVNLQKSLSKNPEKVKFENIKIQKILNLYSYQKTLECFKLFCINDGDILSNELRQIIMGSFTGSFDANLLRDLASKKLFELSSGFKLSNQSLNKSQINAIQKSLTERLTLIVGPPGTGKTLCGVEIICEYIRLQRLKIQEQRKKILVCAESNYAIDIIYTYLKDKDNILIYKFSSKDDLNYEIIKSNISSSEIILCTNIDSSNKLFKIISFPFVIIDECSQSTELNTIIPLLHHCEQLVLIGDNKQLPINIVSNESSKLGLNKSLFERLYEFQINTCILDTQYRMHSSLFEFSSREFYDNKIVSGISNEKRVLSKIKFPNPNYNIMFINVSGNEQFDKNCNSIYNEVEVNKVLNLLNKITSEINDKSIGIITPYDSQKNRIKKAIFENKISEENIFVNNIEGFQGIEKDIIIVSLVKNNDYSKFNFVNDPRKINLLLTRAKYGLIVIGDENYLKNNSFWKKWFEFVKEKNLI